MWRLLIILNAIGTLHSAVLVDRIAVIAGKQVIKSSDLERDLRLTAFINRQQIDTSGAARRKAAERLVDQQIIRQELSAQGYSRATDADADALAKQIAQQRFQGSEIQLNTALARYGLTKNLLHDQLLWQLTVLRFIEQRFRPAVLVTEEDVKTYYEGHLADLKREYPKENSLQALSEKIKASLEGERIDKEFESWLDEARKLNRIEYKDAAFDDKE